MAEGDERSARTDPPEDSRARLRRAGLRVTAARLAVLDAFAGANRHLDADGLADAVRRRLGSLSTQAAYDNLRALVEAGLVRRLARAGGPARYELDRGGQHRHHHAVCRRCGAIADADGAPGDVQDALLPEGAAGTGYEIDEVEVIYWGRCPACVRATSLQPESPRPESPRPESARQR